jgi:rare lipoprotein A (peptidoglycan hydrolase)
MATGQNGAADQKGKAKNKAKAKDDAGQQAADQAAAVAADCVATAAAGGAQATDTQATDTQATGGQDAAAAGDVVCPGSTVTTSGDGGTPAASSNQFPVGTMLKVTNLDNAKSITVPVTSTSGSCALLNNAAFAKVHEAGKQLIRNAKIQQVG